MEKMNGFFFVMLFLLAITIVASADEGKITKEVEIAPKGEDSELPPEYDYEEEDEDDDEDAMPPEPSKEQLKYLKECMMKMKPECAREVFVYMFQDLNVTKECCGDLVAMGEPCHIALVRTVFSIPEYKANAPLGIPRSKQIWNKCAVVVAPGASSPIPFEYFI
ncbi:hypothetical protein PTKIN_Ptkin19aG0022300 [Pterospermum kingtungense]